jgi:signal transduction histidine kinase
MGELAMRSRATVGPARLPGLAALAALGIAMALGAGAIILTSPLMPHRGAYEAFNAVLGWSFLGVGLYAWRRYPENRSGPLIAWVGFLWFLSPLEFSGNVVIFTVGGFTDPLPIAALAHLILAFPDGRLKSRYHRNLIAAGYLNSTLLLLPGTLFWNTADDSICAHCPANPLLIAANNDLHNAFGTLVNVFAVGIIALVAREAIPRIRRAGVGERQVYDPVIYAGVAALVAFACLFVSAGVGGSGATALRFLAFGLFAVVPYAFLAGLIRGRLSHATAVARLVDTLGRPGDERGSLRDAIAAALGDSSVILAYWIALTDTYVDAGGRRVELPKLGSGRIATPIERAGIPLAIVIHEDSLAGARELVSAVGGAAALALENERLEAELRARIEDLRLSRARIVQAADDERRRLERDLHDGAQQRLVAIALSLKIARTSIDGDPAAARDLLDGSIGELTAATAELRELARGIHPAILTDRGLDAAINALAGRASVPVEVRNLSRERHAASVESTAYFVVAEALTNVARYSQASHAQVEIGRRNGTLVVEVRDDGVGGADPRRGSGLRGLADRVAAVDGQLRVTSAPAAGTTVHAEIPCAP